MARVLFTLSLIVLTVAGMAQSPLGGGAVIQGIVRFRQGPVPGAIVTAVHIASGKTTSVVTEVNGQYILKVGDTGAYHVTVDMTGFSADSADWMDGLSERLDVANELARRVAGLVDPQGVVDIALGPLATAETRQAIARAESRPQALALLLMASEFQRS